jgi:hypothetical protein
MEVFEASDIVVGLIDRAMSEVEETKGLKQPEEEEPQEGQRRKVSCRRSKHMVSV